MDRKKEISSDIWEIMCQVYNIHREVTRSEKQEKLLSEIVAYVEAKQQLTQPDERKKKCSKQ
jgi:hypothetical protein